jgi:hypothetical protein
LKRLARNKPARANTWVDGTLLLNRAPILLCQVPEVPTIVVWLVAASVAM